MSKHTRTAEAEKVLVSPKQLFDKCAFYLDYEGDPAFRCTTCKFYDGFKNRCYWETEKKELFVK